MRYHLCLVCPECNLRVVYDETTYDQGPGALARLRDTVMGVVARQPHTVQREPPSSADPSLLDAMINASAEKNSEVLAFADKHAVCADDSLLITLVEAQYLRRYVVYPSVN